MNATTILIRRVKQGIAEWYRFQLKEKAWRGFEQHTLDGYNIGGAPYGYTADRIPHPDPAKAAQGRTKTRLVLDPPAPPWWRRSSPGAPWTSSASPPSPTGSTPTPAAYPPPKPGGWTAAGVYAILRNPKYTGHMVYGRAPHPPAAAASTTCPQDQWLWSPEPAHPAIITRADLGHRPEHRRRARQRPRRARAGRPPAPPAAPTCCRSRCRCRDCKRRMTGRLVRPYHRPPRVHLLRLPPQPRQPPPRRRRPRPPPHRQGPRRRPARPSSASSSPPASSAPTAPPCSPHSCPPAPPRTPPAANRRPPGCTSGCGRSTPPRTPTPAKSRTSPPSPRTPRRSPRCGPGSSPGSPNWKPNATEINERLAALDRATGQQDEPGLLDALPMLGDALHRPARQPSRPGCSPPSAWN